MKEQKFIGRVKVINTKYGELIKISLGPQDLSKVKNGWINMILKKGKEGGYYMVEDEYEKKDVNIPKKNIDLPF